jgi:hypothetical protein
VIPLKANPKKKYRSKILNQTNIDGWNWGKKSIKKSIQNKINSN